MKECSWLVGLLFAFKGGGQSIEKHFFLLPYFVVIGMCMCVLYVHIHVGVCIHKHAEAKGQLVGILHHHSSLLRQDL